MRKSMNEEEELKEFDSCVRESCPDLIMLLVSGSAAHGEMTERSDVDGTVFVECSSRSKLENYVNRFDSLARHEFGKPVEDGFYDPHWSLFLYPEGTIRDKETFAEFHNGLPVDFTMFNLKENSLLLRGEDLRSEFPVEYSSGMIDEWASFAPSYHLERAERLAEVEDRVRACYALSRSILQATRVLVWKEAECTSSSYREIVSAYRELNGSGSLPIWALEARERNFNLPLEEIRNRLELSDRFVRHILQEEVYRRDQLD
ncbi:hypothetical protein AKJ41_03010 [candidate division MSBL1 archaeon SCGC-AAA259O05]|uniref:Polymerase nucleotidyl transferase domain-containing protein n=1 Tax=candidate division MSBL1 archaeon SCGC-AAA259O05 TaxID=1698271 RepID=A0A133V3K0_9EURY|nr:hypothetical protein AKJ41_03010 [candidate division MSBL1 archaeon SCGC-AAA259O05]